MFTKRNLLIIGIILCAALAAGVLYVARFPGGRGTVPQPQTRGAQYSYVNGTYRYTVNYPAAYEAKAYTPEYVSIGADRDGSFVSVLDMAVMRDTAAPTAGATFTDFVHGAAQLACAADGPTATVRCPRVARSQAFTTTNGLVGEKFYLDREVRASDKVLSTEAGPFYAFNLASPRASHEYAALLLYPPSPLLASQSDLSAAESIIDSLQIQ